MLSFISQRLLSLRSLVLAQAACLFCLAGVENVRAATIGTGDVTATLGPTFFVDDAATGGSDTTVPQTTGTGYNRIFAGLLNTHQGPTRVTLTGFGFATTGTTASSLTVTFTYLGADEAVGGSDDVAMGSATGTLTPTARSNNSLPASRASAGSRAARRRSGRLKS